MELSPVLIFCYNRPVHLRRTIEALQQNKYAAESELYIFSDNYKSEKHQADVIAVRDYIHTIEGFKNLNIIERETNLGVSKSIITGVSDVLQKYKRAIVLEDDMITAPFFLEYMNECLMFYEKDQSVFSISAFTPPINIPDTHPQYISTRPCAWGWATWYNRWIAIDWEITAFNSFIHDKEQRKSFNSSGKDSTIMLLKQKTGQIDSWAVRFYFNCFLQHKYCVYPRSSLLYNIGFDGSGSQNIRSRKFDVELSAIKISPGKVELNGQIQKSFQKAYEPSFLRKMINFWKLRKYLYQFPE